MLKVPAQEAPEPAIQGGDLQAQHAGRWLNTQCSMVSRCAGGAVYGFDGSGAVLLAGWPDSSYNPALALDLIARAAGQRERLDLPHGDAGTRLIQPITLYGADSDLVVVLDVDTRDPGQLKVIGNLLGWGSEWLTVPLLSSMPGCGKLSISGSFSGEYRWRFLSL